MHYRAFVFGLMLGGMTLAAEAVARAPVARINPDQPVPAQLREVVSLLDHEDYSEVGAEARREILAAVDSINRLMGGRETLDALNPDDRVEVLNHQSTINTLMARAHADSRMVCERHKPIGSNRPTRVCMTVAERRRVREQTERMMQEGAGRQQPFDPTPGL